MTLADIIREKKAVALYCPICRRWHPIEEKRITEIKAGREAAFVICSYTEPEKKMYSTGIVINGIEPEIFDNWLYKLFVRWVLSGKTICNYMFYANNDKLYFEIRDDPMCGFKGNISLNDLEENLFWVEVKPCIGSDSDIYSATIEIMFLIKSKGSCENCERAKINSYYPCPDYERAYGKYMKGLQEDECYTKTYVFGFRYNLKEEEIKDIPILYDILKLRREYLAIVPDIKVRVSKSIIRLENLMRREQMAEFDGYNDRINKMKKLLKRLETIYKKIEKNPDIEIRDLFYEYYFEKEENMKGLTLVQIFNVFYHYRLKITKDILRDRISQCNSLKQEIDKIEREVLEFIRRFDENTQRRKRELMEY